MSDPVLLVGCPDSFRLLVPPDATCIEPTSNRDPLVVVVGTNVRSPIFEAQRLARLHRGSTMIVTASHDRLPTVQLQLQVTPFIPLSTRVVLDEIEIVRDAIVRALARSKLRRRQRRVAERASEQTIRPPLSMPARDTEALSGFYEAYSKRRAAIVRAACQTLPPVAATMATEIESEAEAELERRAAEGDWAPYLDRLARRGRTSFDLGVTSHDWLRFHVVLRRTASQLIPDGDHDVLSGMERLMSRAHIAISEGLAAARTQLARQQRHAEQVLGSFVETSRDAVLTMTMDASITSWNRGAQDRYGYRASEIVGTHMSVLIPAELQPEFDGLIGTVARGGFVTDHQTKRLHRDGTLLDISLSLSPIRTATDIVGVLSVARDITAELRTTQKLRAVSTEVVALEARKSAMLDAALDAVVTIAHDGNILEFNPAAERMFGWAASEVVGRSLAAVIVPERFRQRHHEGLASRVRDPASTVNRRLEVPALHRDGREMPVEISIVRLAGIEPPTFTGFIRDLTDLKATQAELERTIAVLEQSNHDLERFAYIASHDLQEPLRMVTTFMELLRESYGGQLDERADSFIGHAVDGARRMKGLIDDLLQYSRVHMRTTPPSACDVATVLARVTQDLALMLEESSGTVDWNGTPVVWADERQLEQVFVNLIGNAIKFRHPDRTPRVEVRIEERAEHWRVSIVDNGIGFEAAQAERIFEMFQRLHGRESYQGSGIGLAIAKRIVERHGGKLWAESTPGAGSRFCFELAKPENMEGT